MEEANGARGRQLVRRLLHASSAYRLLEWRYGGLGTIFALHRVVPPSTPVLSPRAAVSTTLLDRLLRYLRDNHWDLIALDELPARLEEPRRGRRFACFTFDDGYVDTLVCALPVFRRYEAPLAVYVTSGFVDRTVACWWATLEALVLRAERVILTDAGERVFPTGSLADKRRAYPILAEAVFRFLQAERHDLVGEFFRRHSVAADEPTILDRTMLNWRQLEQLAAEHLVTIGSHTVSHPSLSLLDTATAQAEIEGARARLQDRLQIPVDHFAYPFGRRTDCGTHEFDLVRQLGIRTAVTTRAGNVHPAHRHHLTALPRVAVDMTSDVREIRVRLSTMGATASRGLDPVVTA